MILRCSAGHLYDSHRHEVCPLCHPAAAEAEPAASLPEINPPEPPILESVLSPEQEMKHLSGWLVCTAGPEYGCDFQLYNGYNYIGTTASRHIRVAPRSLSGAERSAVLCYDDETQQFLLGSCGGSKLVRINGTVILETTALNPFDVISIGNLQFLFIPLCCEHFHWEKN